MLYRISSLLVFVVVLCNGVVFAHGNEAHIMGTVTAVDPQHVVVKTREGESISILLNVTTRYRQGEVAATATDLQVGDRVYVEAMGEEETLAANEIRFTSTRKKSDAEAETPSNTETPSYTKTPSNTETPSYTEVPSNMGTPSHTETPRHTGIHSHTETPRH